MSWRDNLRKGRSHVITVVVLIVASGIIVRIEDETLQREAGKTPPRHRIDVRRPALQGHDAPPRKPCMDEAGKPEPCPALNRSLSSDRPASPGAGD